MCVCVCTVWLVIVMKGIVTVDHLQRSDHNSQKLLSSSCSFFSLSKLRQYMTKKSDTSIYSTHSGHMHTGCKVKLSVLFLSHAFLLFMCEVLTEPAGGTVIVKLTYGPTAVSLL